MLDKKTLAEFRRLAATIDGIDKEVYATYGKSPFDPVIGLGKPAARVGFFGRDPGRDEVQHAMPFIGAGGQKVRGALYQHLYGEALPDFAASVAIGENFFWANTVPYKPLGNKAWSMKVKKLFQPLMVELLLTTWEGRDMITLGREAFLWFGINQVKETQQRLNAFWESEERFEQHIEVELAAPSGLQRNFRLHPLPHPSPLNATWYKRFPELLRARLTQLKVTPTTLLSR